MTGAATAVVAGGTESMSLVPMGGNKVSPNPALVDVVSRRLSEHRARRREPRARVVDPARGAGCLRAAQPPARDRRDRRRPVRGRTRRGDTGHSTFRVSPFHHRRRAAARHVDGGARTAASGVPRHRHGHGRQLVADERRRRGGARHGRRPRSGARPEALRAVRRHTPPPASNPNASASDPCRPFARS